MCLFRAPTWTVFRSVFDFICIELCESEKSRMHNETLWFWTIFDELKKPRRLKPMICFHYVLRSHLNTTLELIWDRFGNWCWIFVGQWLASFFYQKNYPFRSSKKLVFEPNGVLDLVWHGTERAKRKNKALQSFEV